MTALLSDYPTSAATVVEWDPATFANVLDRRGGRIVDAPALGAVAALAIQPGDTVVLLECDGRPMVLGCLVDLPRAAR